MVGGHHNGLEAIGSRYSPRVPHTLLAGTPG